MRIANTPWAGRHPANPAYVSDAVYLRALDAAREDLGATHVRFGVAFDSIYETPDRPDFRRLVWVVEQAIRRGLGVVPVIGGGPYPNQPAWHGICQRKTWDPAVPPLPAQALVASLNGMIWGEVVRTVARLGREPRLFAIPQFVGEVCIGGANGSRVSTDPEGTWTAPMLDWIEYLVSKFPAHGCRTMSPSFECQLVPFPREVATAFASPSTRPRYIWPAFDCVALSCYEWTEDQGPLDRLKYCAQMIRNASMKTKAHAVPPSFVAVEMGKVGATAEQIKAWCDEVESNGFGSGWYSVFSRAGDKWNYLPG